MKPELSFKVVLLRIQTDIDNMIPCRRRLTWQETVRVILWVDPSLPATLSHRLELDAAGNNIRVSENPNLPGLLNQIERRFCRMRFQSSLL